MLGPPASLWAQEIRAAHLRQVGADSSSWCGSEWEPRLREPGTPALGQLAERLGRQDIQTCHQERLGHGEHAQRWGSPR